MSLSCTVDVDGVDLFLYALIVRCGKGVVVWDEKSAWGRVSRVDKVDADAD